MFISGRKYDNGSVIGLWRLDESPEELLALLNDKTVEEQIGSFSETRKRERLASRVLLSRLYGKPYQIAYQKDGRPYEVNNLFQVSISHTKDMVAVIINPTRKVGIDIENLSDRVNRIKHKFLSADELEHVTRIDEVSYTLLYWCAKEVLFKIIAEEGIDFAAQLHITPFEPAATGRIMASESRTPERKHYVLEYEITDHILVWTVD